MQVRLLPVSQVNTLFMMFKLYNYILSTMPIWDLYLAYIPAVWSWIG